MPYDPTNPYGVVQPQGPQGPMPMQAPQVNPMMGMQRPRIPMPQPGQMPQGGQMPQPGQMMQRPMLPGGPGQINPQALAALMARLQGGQMPAPNPGQMPMRPQMMPPQGPAPQMMPPQQQGPAQGNSGALQALLGVPNYSALQSRLRGVLGV